MKQYFLIIFLLFSICGQSQTYVNIKSTNTTSDLNRLAYKTGVNTIDFSSWKITSNTCDDNQILKYDLASNTFLCADDDLGTATAIFTKDGISYLQDTFRLGGALTDSVQIDVNKRLISLQDTSIVNESNTKFIIGLSNDVLGRYKNTNGTTLQLVTIDSFNRSSTIFVNENEAYLGTDSLQNRFANIRATHNNLRPAISLEARTSSNQNSLLTLTGDGLGLVIEDDIGFHGAKLRRPSDSAASGLKYGTASNWGKLNIEGTSFSQEDPILITNTTTVTTYTLPVTWDGIEGDVISLVNKSGISKDITGHIDNVTPTTISVLDGNTVRFIYDDTNDTWWQIN